MLLLSAVLALAALARFERRAARALSAPGSDRPQALKPRPELSSRRFARRAAMRRRRHCRPGRPG